MSMHQHCMNVNSMNIATIIACLYMWIITYVNRGERVVFRHIVVLKLLVLKKVCSDESISKYKLNFVFNTL